MKFFVSSDYECAILDGERVSRQECGSCSRYVYIFKKVVLKIDSVRQGPSRQCEAEAIFFARLKPSDRIHFAAILESGYYNDRAYVIQERIFGGHCYNVDKMSELEKRFGLYDIDSRNAIVTDSGHVVIVDYGLSAVWEEIQCGRKE